MIIYQYIRQYVYLEVFLRIDINLVHKKMQ